ncbi:uncharacterized protein LOC126603560 isoform X5 [Malus sylvestris]|uniref:uncharacterized protein LOC126603560 isoform X5 n=1 Tax=Malus sylvestris TaxID=3752 RepID=UPI0021AC1D02|nr:uncharacterized protein LOC126603560 isoform X5 [Malus sylvestris]
MMMASRTPGTPRAKKEKIVVLVCLRPLSKREELAKEQVSWDCLGDNTIVYKPPPHERSAQSTSFTFDKVFGPGSTEAVYEEGVRNVALSSLMGINATIFAYGQSGSGKTYTMRRIMEKAVDDIYNHMIKTPEREFAIKISGLEIYNENVRDLLNTESVGNLKLLDDPEKGIVVEKLVEEAASSHQHLRSLIGICEAQREVGETALNENSSRSHQIIRLTIESTVRESLDCRTSFVASLNFVDLAGSERAPDTHADGVRLREGCHINLSLMTLTNVIRKLSAGKLSGHIPYRDSKLTRILQHSLGGNARTAIICTLSPALSHAEQSRNTLFFATQAKEVTNDASVNTVVSDKQLVKHLQKQVAKLEAELYTLYPLRERIQQMEMEMEDLRSERDLARSQADELRHKLEVQSLYPLELPHRSVDNYLSYTGVLPTSFYAKELGDCDTATNARTKHSIRHSATPPFMPRREVLKHEISSEQLSEEPSRALKLEVLYKSKLVIGGFSFQNLAFRFLEDLFRPREVTGDVLEQIKNEPVKHNIVPLLGCWQEDEAEVDGGFHLEPGTSNAASPDVSAVEYDHISEHVFHVQVEHPADRYEKKAISDEAKELMDCHRETSDSGAFRNGKIDVSVENRDFLGFLCSNGGQLLICNTSNCPFVFHQNFLDSDLICYKKGKYYCPICSYSLAYENRLGEIEEKLSRKAVAFDEVFSGCTDGCTVNEQMNARNENGYGCDCQFDDAQVHNQFVGVEDNEIKEGTEFEVEDENNGGNSVSCRGEGTNEIIRAGSGHPCVSELLELQQDEETAVEENSGENEEDEGGKRVFVEKEDEIENAELMQPESMELPSNTIVLSDTESPLVHKRREDNEIKEGMKFVEVEDENNDVDTVSCRDEGTNEVIRGDSEHPCVSELLELQQDEETAVEENSDKNEEDEGGKKVFAEKEDEIENAELMQPESMEVPLNTIVLSDTESPVVHKRREYNEIKEGMKFEVEDENNDSDSVSCRGEGTNEVIRGDSEHPCVSELLELQQDEETAVEENSDKNEEDEGGKRVFAEKENEIKNAELMQPESLEMPSNTIVLSDTESPVVHKNHEKAPKSFTIVLSDSSESDASDTWSPSMEPEVSDTRPPLLGEIQPKHKGQKTREFGNQPTSSNLPLPRTRRRMRLYWTREEEEKLKELVNSFPTTGKYRCWKKILENGRDVFHKDRTPNDLRNKWGKMRVKGNAEF